MNSWVGKSFKSEFSIYTVISEDVHTVLLLDKRGNVFPYDAILIKKDFRNNHLWWV